MHVITRVAKEIKVGRFMNCAPPSTTAQAHDTEHMLFTKTLITCHANADFDAFAAIIAAHILYPGASLYFPGSQERSLQSFYNDSAVFAYNFKKHDEIQWEEYNRLVIVDTRQRTRVSHVSALLERSDVEIHIWDHHPVSGDDIETPHIFLASVGATTTLMIREIRARNIDISCQDATILGLGIYADTGSFTYSSTVPEDYEAAAWLREKGMDVTAIADLAAHELTSAHVQALSALLESATTYQIGTVPVVIADVSMDHYLGDFALLAHKLMEMERFEVLFALGRMADRVTVVARSRTEHINVGRVCTILGGGGHAYAASASVRHKTIQQVREDIYQMLFSQTHVHKSARDYMTYPPVGIEVHKTMQEAHDLMNHFGFKAIPIFATGTNQCVGILDAYTASRAVNHCLTDIDNYMQQQFSSLSPDAALSELMDIIVSARQHLVPIVHNEQTIGVVTRTDLIHIFVNDPQGISLPYRESRKERNLAKLMRDRLPANILQLLQKAGDLGDRLGVTVYTVGGFVRDLLLEKENVDVDLVVEGNGIEYAKALAKELGGRMRAHQEFLTAVVVFEEDGQEKHIDVATARLEYYKYPAAMPTVELSSIKLDLFRRDFTINALALRLSKNAFGQLVDYFGGQRDIHDKKVRVLHTLSFVEDPSRVLRAVRFEQRYDFKLGPMVEKLIKNTLTLQLMDKLQGARMFHEFIMMCGELDPVASMQRLDQLGVLPTISKYIALNPQKILLLRRIKDILDWYHLLYFSKKPERWMLYIFGLSHKLNYTHCAELIDRLGVPKVQQHDFLVLREYIRSLRPLVTKWFKRKGSVSELCDILSKASLESVLFLMARIESEDLRRYISYYITTWQNEKIDISGRDLMALGLEPGPLFGQLMRKVKSAKLDGLAPTRESQYILAKTLALQYKNKHFAQTNTK